MASALHVLHTVDYSPWSRFHGGAQHLVHHLACALARRGHRVEVVFTKPPWERVTPPTELPYRLSWAPFVGWRSVRHASLRPLNAFTVAAAVRRRLRRVPADRPLVLHGHGEEAALLGRVRPPGAAFVASAHYGMYPSAWLAPPQTAWARRLADLRVLVREPRYVGLGAALRGADLVCPPSAHVADLVQRAYGLAPDRLHPVPGGIAAPFLEVEPAGGPDGPVVYAGRFTRVRGVDLVLDAAERLAPEGVRVVLVGRPERDAALAARLARLAANGTVEVHPWLPQPALAALFARASAVLVPSRHESFGLAAAEAMACGAPVVAARAGALPELVADGRTGLLVPAGDAAALAEAVRALRADPPRARALGAAACAWVRTRYTWDAAAAACEAAYDEALRRASRTRSATCPQV